MGSLTLLTPSLAPARTGCVPVTNYLTFKSFAVYKLEMVPATPWDTCGTVLTCGSCPVIQTLEFLIVPVGSVLLVLPELLFSTICIKRVLWVYGDLTGTVCLALFILSPTPVSSLCFSLNYSKAHALSSQSYAVLADSREEH